MNQEQKGNLVQGIVRLLDEELEESIESKTKLLMRSEPGSEARIALNHLASTFWDDLVSTCEKHDIDLKGEWIRVRSNFSTSYKRLKKEKRNLTVEYTTTSSFN